MLINNLLQSFKYFQQSIIQLQVCVGSNRPASYESEMTTIFINNTIAGCSGRDWGAIDVVIAASQLASANTKNSAAILFECFNNLTY